MWSSPKIFCIGFHKTGTTSAGNALSVLGYRRFGWDGAKNSSLLFRWHERHPDFEKVLRNTVEEYDAFEDMPWPLLWRECERMFPNARFILTVRQDTDTWLRSIQRHMARINPWVGMFLIYGSYDPVADAARHAEVYEAHNAAIRAHFRGADNFLEVCFERGDGWAELCSFLNVPVPDRDFPHDNKTNA